MYKRVEILRYSEDEKIKGKLKATLDKWSDIFPVSANARIFIKPNLNSDMNALTGNTTDLRVIIALIEFLKDRGYLDITVGDGTNFGFYKNRVNVIERLKIDRVGKRYGVKVVDLNFSEGVEIDIGEIKAKIARECMEADFLINLPKLKTHFEAAMSVCLKNLVGCLVAEDKRNVHKDLKKGIVGLNRAIKTDLNIIDGLIAMEGFGPSRGIPVNMGTVIMGNNPFYLDLLCARMTGFDVDQVPALLYAEEVGLLDKTWLSEIDNILEAYPMKKLKQPDINWILRVIQQSWVQKRVEEFKKGDLFRYLSSTRLMGWVLYNIGIRQDAFSSKEVEWRCININDTSKCGECRKCAKYCPVDIDLPETMSPQDCIECLYCYMVCPEQVIEFEGSLGFMDGYLKKYSNLIKNIS